MPRSDLRFHVPVLLVLCVLYPPVIDHENIVRESPNILCSGRSPHFVYTHEFRHGFDTHRAWMISRFTNESEQSKMEKDIVSCMVQLLLTKAHSSAFFIENSIAFDNFGDSP
jgi:hypothetical protein